MRTVPAQAPLGGREVGECAGACKSPSSAPCHDLQLPCPVADPQEVRTQVVVPVCYLLRDSRFVVEDESLVRGKEVNRLECGKDATSVKSRPASFIQMWILTLAELLLLSSLAPQAFIKSMDSTILLLMSWYALESKRTKRWVSQARLHMHVLESGRTVAAPCQPRNLDPSESLGPNPAKEKDGNGAPAGESRGRLLSQSVPLTATPPLMRALM